MTEPRSADLTEALDHLEHGDAVAAERLFRAALAAKPDFAPAIQGIAKALYDQRRFEEAEEVFRQAEWVDPVPAVARFHRGLCRLVQGDMAEGWRLWEARLENPAGNHPKLPIPRWQGEPLNGERLLVIAEQGYGDVIQFVRFLPRVVETCGGTVTFAGALPLQRLLEPFAARHGFRLEGGRIRAEVHDCFASVGSLPGLFGVRLEDLPGPMPYLEAPPRLVARWQAARPAGKLAVGLCWAGRALHPQDKIRSLPVARLAPIARVPNVALMGLQKPMEERADSGAMRAPDELLCADWGPNIEDFADTAAMVAALDLVLTVDTSIAHLAGALGKPAWVMLPYAPDWRWLLDRSDSPWYPSLRLYRQSRLSVWDDVIEAVAKDLTKEAARRACA